MKKSIKISVVLSLLGPLLVGAALAAGPAAAVAAAGSGWSGSGPGSVLESNGSVTAPAFRYATQSQGTYTFVRTATTAGTVTLPWTWSGDHGVNRSTRFLSFGKFKNNQPFQHTVVVDAAAPMTGSGAFTEGGKLTLTVAKNEVYGFQLIGAGRDASTTVNGRLVLPNPPTVTVPTQPVTATTDDETGTAVSFTATGADGAGGALTPVCTPASGSKFPLGDTTVSCTVTDAATQTATATFTVRVFYDEPNVSWPKAALMGGADSRTGKIRTIDQALWYRFPVQPDSVIQVDLKNLGANYDLTLFGDIGAAFNDALSVRDLNQLSAEFAADAFSPSAYSPSVFSPSAYSPSVFSPSVYSPEAFTPSVFSPSVFSPSVYSPSVFSPSVFSPSVFSPSVYSPAVSLPSVFSPSVFSPSVYSPDELRSAFSSAQIRTLIAVSSRDGLADEQIRANTWGGSGFFYVRVQGRNGAFAPTQPFTVSTATSNGPCAAPMQDFSSTATFRGTPGSATTLILTDSARLSGAPVPALQAFAARAEIRGAVVDAASIPRVQALQAQADQLKACPYAKNLVAQELRNVVNSYRDAAGTLKYVVIAGNDDVIPFFRSADGAGLGPEQGYVPPVDDASASQAALRRNQVLSQDQYGAETDVTLKGAELPVPDLGVGRLIETPAQITAALTRYNALAGGTLPTPQSGLVTGYDFLTDAADQVADHLDAGLGAGRTDELITDRDVSPTTTTVNGTPDRRHSWTAADLRSAFLGERHDVVLLAGHFSANSALAADNSTSMLTTEVRDSNVDLTNSLVFSVGCHSGYNIVDGDAIPGLTEKLDWSEVMADKGAVFVGGTGYQYGDTDLLEYSERLYSGVLAQLRTGTGAVAIGDALTRAKQTYLATTPVISGIHQKALVEATLYGLPMVKMNLPSGRIAATSPAKVTPSAVTTGPGAQLGLKAYDLTANGATTLVTQPFDDVDDTGRHEFTYLRGVNGVTTAPGQPALPLQSFDVGATGVALRGLGFRSGTYADVPGIVPLTGAPSTDLSEVHTRFSSPVFFPRRTAQVNTYGAIEGDGGTRLLVGAAQHRSDSAFTSTLRRYSSLTYRLTYSGNVTRYNGNVPALAAPPAVSQVSSTVTGNQVQIVARVVGDPSAGIQNVWVTRTAETGPWYGAWNSVDMVQDSADSTKWTITLTLPSGQAAQDVRFIVQATNGVGLVTMEDNQGREFIPGVDADALPPAGSANSTLVLDAPTTGVLGDTLEVSATLTGSTPLNGRTVLFALGGATQAATTDADGVARASFPIVEQPGAQQLSATFDGDSALSPSAAQQVVTVAKRTTSLGLEGPPGPVFAGDDSGVTAVLRSGTTPITDRSVIFVVRNGAGEVVAAAARRTGPDGRAGLGAVALPTGTLSVKAFFGQTGVDVGNGETSGSEDPENKASTSAPLALQVNDAVPPVIVTASLPDGRAGQAYQANLQVTGDPAPTVTVTGLPPGYSYLLGTVSGTTAVAGTYSVSVTATNGGGTVTRQLTLVVTAGTPTAPVVISGSGQGTAFGTVFKTALVVRVADAYGNPVPGQTVTFTSPSSGAGTSPRTFTAVTGSDGRATATPTAGTTIGWYDVVASVPNAGSTTFRLANWYALSSFSSPFTAADGGYVDLPASTNAPLSVQVSDAGGPTGLFGGIAGALGCRITVTEVTTNRSFCMAWNVVTFRFTYTVKGSNFGWKAGQERVLRVTVWNGSEVQGMREVRVRVT